VFARRRSDGRREADAFDYVLRGRLGGVLPGGVTFESRGTIGADALRR
jgi:hypothetical protein